MDDPYDHGLNLITVASRIYEANNVIADLPKSCATAGWIGIAIIVAESDRIAAVVAGNTTPRRHFGISGPFLGQKQG